MTNLAKSLPDLIEFLSFSFGGGTDADPALQESLRQVQTKQYKKADILMISDFIMDALDKITTQKIDACKKTGTRFHSLVISSEGNPNVLKIFDNNWLYNTTSDHPFRDVLKNIRHIRTLK
ncbi:MAG TPA: hypothetical protein VKM55_23315 [Candidatus Lokiarchaeia archaeon]|nr:hypothetical protein [Candidatus Lokiarchaeia archaeon]